MSTFNNPFDYTFRPRFVDTVNPQPIQTGCRKDGIYLTWLTLQGGWQYWLFDGPVLQGQSTSSRGQVEQDNLINFTQKTTAPTLTLHTANLSEEEAKLVGTLRESISAYMLVHNDDDTIEPIRVTVPVGDAQLWDSQSYKNNFSIVITLPGRPSQLL